MSDKVRRARDQRDADKKRPKMIGIMEVAERLGCHPATIHRLIKEKRPGFPLPIKQCADWMFAEPGILEIVWLNDMVQHAPTDDEVKPGRVRWQFYEDVEHMLFWYEHRYLPGRGGDRE